jgi:hypothetical protein
MPDQELTDALRDALVPQGNGIITRYVVIAEYVDAEDGRAMLVRDQSDGLAEWECQGLLWNALNSDPEDWIQDDA